MELKSFKEVQITEKQKALSSLAHAIKNGYWMIVDDLQITDTALSSVAMHIIKVK